MQRFRIGRVDGPWENFVPPIQGGRFPAQDFSPSQGSQKSILSPDLANPSSHEPKNHQLHSLESLNVMLDNKTPATSRYDNSQEQITSTESYQVAPIVLDPASDAQINLDKEKYPSLDLATQRSIVQKYRALNDQIRAAGLYRCNYAAYGIEILRYLALFSTSILFLRAGWFGMSGAFLGMFWHQLVFTAHDAGHMGITHHFHTDTVVGIIIADFLGGLSLGWWKRNHNVHHIVTNSPEHDPDIEHMPFFAISTRFFESLYSTYYERVMEFDWFAKLAVRGQHYLYYPLLTLGRFNLYVHSWAFLALGLGPRKGPAWWHRWLEIIGNVFFWGWYGYGIVYRCIPTLSGRIVFVLVSHMITGLLHVQITLSHFAMSTSDLGVNESFPQKMLRTTMDVDCPEWLDFFHGGLQFQAIHHLYPRIPRHNLRKTQKLVQGFCQEVGIPYTLYGFAQGNREVLGRLGEVGKQAALLAECQKAAARKISF